MSILVYIIYRVVLIYIWLIIARALLSWFPVRYGSPIHRIKDFLFTVTEPYLRLFRRLLPTARIGAVGLDLSAMIGVIVLVIVVQALVRFA